MPLWLIGLLLKARKVTAWIWKWACEPLHVTMPLGLWVLVAIGFVAVMPMVKYRQGRIDGRAQIQKTIDAPVTGWAARLKDCQAGRQALQTSIDTQNAAMTKRSQQATASLDQAAKAQRDVQPLVKAKTREAAQILKPLIGADVCQRMFEVDERFLGQLK